METQLFLVLWSTRGFTLCQLREAPADIRTITLKIEGWCVLLGSCNSSPIGGVVSLLTCLPSWERELMPLESIWGCRDPPPPHPPPLPIVRLCTTLVGLFNESPRDGRQAKFGPLFSLPFSFLICWQGTRTLFVFETIKVLVSGTLSSSHLAAVILLLPGYNRLLHPECMRLCGKINRFLATFALSLYSLQGSRAVN